MNAPTRVAVLVAILSFLVCASPTSGAFVHHYAEDFSTTRYMDPAFTTAWWDTAGGQLGLRTFNPRPAGAYDTPGTAYDVVHRPKGAAGKVLYLRDYSVAAKTGTAELGKATLNNAWIVAFAPYEKPRYAFVICLERVEEGAHGGEAAGPVLVAALEYLSQRDPGLFKDGRPEW